MAAKAPALGRAVQAAGLVVMLAAVAWGMTNDALGVEIIGGFVGFLLIMTGRSLATDPDGDK